MSPVFGLQAVQSVVISVVQCSLCCPVDQSLGKKPSEEVVESGDECHVQGKTITGHPAHHPGPLACAEKCLLEKEKTLSLNRWDVCVSKVSEQPHFNILY